MTKNWDELKKLKCIREQYEKIFSLTEKSQKFKLRENEMPFSPMKLYNYMIIKIITPS